MSVDLRTCKKGDILISKHGKRFIYSHRLPEGHRKDHLIHTEDSLTQICFRNDDGTAFSNGSRDEKDHDIVEIIHIKDENSN